MYNLHKLFRNTIGRECLINNLEIIDNDRKQLAKARTTIRTHLRQGIERLTEQQLGTSSKVSPRFFTQGSWAYKTINDPEINPPQEIDLDDGVYLPMSLFKDTRPSVACDVFFQIVDALLKKLVEKNDGWSLVQKHTCCRVKISEKSHVDLPLYAIPDVEFVRLTEAAAKHGYSSITEAALHLDTSDWLKVESDKVWLAKRGGEWEQSDPRLVSEWFKSQVAMYGEQYVHVCRYLKAWRDKHWVTGGPSSILLMVCASNDFVKHYGRDDLSLLDAAENLIEQLRSDIRSPFTAISLNTLDASERINASLKAQQLHHSISESINNAKNKSDAVMYVRNQFGTRVPNDTTLVELCTHADVVKSYPKAVVPAPAIPKVKAG